MASAPSGICAVWHLRRLAFRALAALRRSGPAPFGARTYGAQATTVADAAREKDVVIVTIPEKAVPDLRDELGGALDAKTVVVDTGNYYPKRDGRITEIESGIPESKWVADQLGRPVVKAFNTIYAHHLLERGKPSGGHGRRASETRAGGGAEERA
jgi:8-hydroxy-5-deazaflavin:NADPH oxidoreductase